MKIASRVLVTIFLALSLVACSKDEDAASSFSAPGKWEGALIDGDNGASAFYGLQLNSNGTLTRYKSTGELLGEGSWEITGNSFKAHYVFPSGSKFSIAGTVDKTKNKMSGTWGPGNNTSGYGTWHATKK